MGRGASPRGLGRSVFCHTYKVSQFGRAVAIQKFADTLKADQKLRDLVWTLSGLRLVCHCLAEQACHADEIVREFRAMFPEAHDRDDPNGPLPDSRTLNYLAVLREEQPCEEGSSAEEGAAPAGFGWRGERAPMMVGTGYVATELCDGQSLASLCRWPPSRRRFPEGERWQAVWKRFIAEACRVGTTALWRDLALGKVEKCPFKKNIWRLGRAWTAKGERPGGSRGRAVGLQIHRALAEGSPRSGGVARNVREGCEGQTGGASAQIASLV